MPLSEFLHVLLNRIKVPLFGYSLLVSIYINWKTLYVVIFDSRSTIEKFVYSDLNTSFTSVVIAPFFIGLLLCTAYPWLHIIVLKLIVKATEQRNNIVSDTEHRKFLYKKQLELEDEDLIGRKEEQLIEQAEREKQISALGDEELRDKIRKEVEGFREEINRKRQDDLENDIFRVPTATEFRSLEDMEESVPPNHIKSEMNSIRRRIKGLESESKALEAVVELAHPNTGEYKEAKRRRLEIAVEIASLSRKQIA